jgi:hypothetical protein
MLALACVSGRPRTVASSSCMQWTPPGQPRPIPAGIRLDARLCLPMPPGPRTLAAHALYTPPPSPPNPRPIPAGIPLDARPGVRTSPCTAACLPGRCALAERRWAYMIDCLQAPSAINPQSWTSCGRRAARRMSDPAPIPKPMQPRSRGLHRPPDVDRSVRAPPQLSRCVWAGRGRTPPRAPIYVAGRPAGAPDLHAVPLAWVCHKTTVATTTSRATRTRTRSRSRARTRTQTRT